MVKIGISLACYAAAYGVVTLIGMLHTVFNITVLHMKSMKDSPGMGEGYERTKPWHPLYNILVFPVFALVYFRAAEGAGTFSNAVMTALVWGTLTVGIDYFGWVMIKHPWSLTAREFYVDYQPWITFIYAAIYLSPFIGYVIAG